MTQRACVTCGQPITVTTRNPNRRFCSPRCRVADWHARHDRPPRTRNPVPPDPQLANGVAAANGTQRCPHCHHDLAVIAVIVPPTATHVRAPEVIPISPT
jgi:hypothetical protein